MANMRKKLKNLIFKHILNNKKKIQCGALRGFAGWRSKVLRSHKQALALRAMLWGGAQLAELLAGPDETMHFGTARERYERNQSN